MSPAPRRIVLQLRWLAVGMDQSSADMKSEEPWKTSISRKAHCYASVSQQSDDERTILKSDKSRLCIFLDGSRERWWPQRVPGECVKILMAAACETIVLVGVIDVSPSEWKRIEADFGNNGNPSALGL